MDAELTNDITVQHENQAINVSQELKAFMADAWNYGTITGEEYDRTLHYFVMAETSQDLVARQYEFVVEIDKLQGARVGELVLNVYEMYNDQFKPVRTLLGEFRGATAEALFALVDRTPDSDNDDFREEAF